MGSLPVQEVNCGLRQLEVLSVNSTCRQYNNYYVYSSRWYCMSTVNYCTILWSVQTERGARGEKPLTQESNLARALIRITINSIVCQGAGQNDYCISFCVIFLLIPAESRREKKLDKGTKTGIEKRKRGNSKWVWLLSHGRSQAEGGQLQDWTSWLVPRTWRPSKAGKI